MPHHIDVPQAKISPDCVGGHVVRAGSGEHEARETLRGQGPALGAGRGDIIRRGYLLEGLLLDWIEACSDYSHDICHRRNSNSTRVIRPYERKRPIESIPQLCNGNSGSKAILIETRIRIILAQTRRISNIGGIAQEFLSGGQ